jgi:hypothetical protein
VEARDGGQGLLVAEEQLLLEARPRVAGESLVHPRLVDRIGHPVERRGAGPRQQHQLDAVDDRAHLPGHLHVRAGHVDQRLAVDRVGRVQVHQLADPVGGPVGDAGDHHAAVAVPDEHHVAEVLPPEQVHDVGDVGVEVDARPQQVRPLPQPGQRRGVHLVTGGAQEPGDLLVAPAAVAASVDEHVRRHQTVPK